MHVRQASKYARTLYCRPFIYKSAFILSFCQSRALSILHIPFCVHLQPTFSHRNAFKKYKLEKRIYYAKACKTLTFSAMEYVNSIDCVSASPSIDRCWLWHHQQHHRRRCLPTPADDVNAYHSWHNIVGRVCRAWMVSCGMSIDALPTCFQNSHTHISPRYEYAHELIVMCKSASWNIGNELTTFLLASSKVLFSIVILIFHRCVCACALQTAQRVTQFQHNL